MTTLVEPAATPDPTAAVAELAPVTAPLLRQALGRFATGVTIVTCRDAEGRAIGLTCNSFNALSLDPPLVLWSLRQASPHVPVFQAVSHFAVNVLAESQIELSRRFARGGVDDRFAEGVWSEGLGGAPVLTGSAAVFECATEAHQAAGDHVLYIGRVQRLTDAGLPPLVFHGGRYHLLGEIL